MTEQQIYEGYLEYMDYVREYSEMINRGELTIRARILDDTFMSYEANAHKLVRKLLELRGYNFPDD